MNHEVTFCSFFLNGVALVEDTLDRETIEKCRMLEPVALDNLFRFYEKRVLGLVYRMVGSQEEAEDIAQEIFVKIFKALPNFRGDSQLTTWIYRITINHCHNYRRKWFVRKNKHAFSLDEELSAIKLANDQHFQNVSTSNPMKKTLQNELASVLERGLLSLSPHLRSIIILRDIEGLNYDEIAETLGISLGTVKSRLNRARTALRKKLASYMTIE